MHGVDLDCLSKERKAQAEAMLNKKLQCRPNRVDLEMQNILKHSYPPNVNPEFASRRESLERQFIYNRLNKQLEYRPGTLELINRGYLVVDNHVDALVRQGMVPFQTVEEVSEDGSIFEENNSATLSLVSHQTCNGVSSSSETDSIILPTSFSDTISSYETYPSKSAEKYPKGRNSIFDNSLQQPPPVPQVARSRSASLNGGNCLPTVAKMSQVTRFGPLTFHTFNPRGNAASNKQQVREQQQKDLLNLERHATLKHNLLDELKNATNTAEVGVSRESVTFSTNSAASTTSATVSSGTVTKKIIPIMSFKLDSFNVSTLLAFCRHLGIRPNTRRKQNLVNQLAPHIDKLRQFLSNNSATTSKVNSEDISNVTPLPATNPPSISTSSPHLFSSEGLPVPITLPSCNPPTVPVEGHFRHSLSTPQFFQNMDTNGSVQRTTSFSSHPYDDCNMSSEFNSVLSIKPLLVSQRSPPNVYTVPNYFSPLPSTVTSTPMNSIGPNYNVCHISAIQHLPYKEAMKMEPQCFPSHRNSAVNSTFSSNGDSSNSFSVPILNNGPSCISSSKPFFEEQSRLDEMLKSITELTRVRNEFQAKKRHSSSSDLGYDGELQQHLQRVESQLQLHMQEASRIMQSMKLPSSELESLVCTATGSIYNQLNDDSGTDPLESLLLDQIFNDFPLSTEAPSSLSTTNVPLQETVDAEVDNQFYSFAPVSSASMHHDTIFINSNCHPVRLNLDSAPYECDKFSTPNPSLRPIDGKNINCNVDILHTETNDTLASIFNDSPMQTNHSIEESNTTEWLSSHALDGDLLASDIFLSPEFVTDDASWDDFMSTEPFSASIR